MIIAIDGESSCGKSTIAKNIATAFQFTYIDTGAMFRCTTLFYLQNNLKNQQELISKLSKINIKFAYHPEKESQEVFLNGINVTQEIRSLEVANKVSEIAAIPEVRTFLLEQQRAMSEGCDVVLDGRDIGTVVFPNAELKLYLTADVKVRAQRRFAEMNDPTVSLEAVEKNLAERDFKDKNRATAPLKIADDAVIIDNSYLSLTEQKERIFKLIKDKQIQLGLA